MSRKETQVSIDQRAERIQAAIAELSRLRADVEAQGDLAQAWMLYRTLSSPRTKTSLLVLSA